MLMGHISRGPQASELDCDIPPGLHNKHATVDEILIHQRLKPHPKYNTETHLSVKEAPTMADSKDEQARQMINIRGMSPQYLIPDDTARGWNVR